MAKKAYFTKELFKFLKDLKKNNNRDWFQKNKPRYEEHVKAPMLAFLTDLKPKMEKVSEYFVVDPRGNGGSMFRIYRDTRFSKDKTPYKTHAAIQLRHETGRDAHAPGYYLHFEPGSCFAGAGMWRPDSPSLRKIRASIDEDGAAWKKAAYGKRFTGRYELHGDALKRAPAGYPADHPWVDDLRRKDFICMANMDPEEVLAPGFLDHYVKLCKDAAPFMTWLCSAVDVSY